ncbi:hypothetical protein C8R44DRAFT_881582 [Mycena epipterygia]|nr:hypothetical protein C8R44DRAFT_881582 [Mycena epipterygia]
MPSLRGLRIQWDGWGGQVSAESIDCFQTAPRMVYTSIHNKYRHIPILLPVHQLTRYDLDCPWEMHMGMLKLAPNLVEARILINFDPEAWPDPGEILDVLCLQRLYLSHPHILQYLNAPALTELALSVDDDDDLDDLLHLEPFVVRSGCTLRRLTFKGSPDAYATGAVLRQCPSVTQLAILLEGSDYSDWGTLYDRANTLIHHLTIPGIRGRDQILQPFVVLTCFEKKDWIFS